MVTLAPKTFDLLVFMAESGGRLISKRELMEKLWNGTFVEEANISFQISSLRKALGQEANTWIEAVPRARIQIHRARWSDRRLERTRTRMLSSGAVPGTRRSSKNPLESIHRRPRGAVSAGSAAANPRPAKITKRAGCRCVRCHLGSCNRRRGPVAAKQPRPATKAAALNPVPLTAAPGWETYPSLSPDGNQVAYTRQERPDAVGHIYVKLIGEGKPVQLTSGPPCI